MSREIRGEDERIVIVAGARLVTGMGVVEHYLPASIPCVA